MHRADIQMEKKEKFLSRWSRLKCAEASDTSSAAAPVAVASVTDDVELLSVETLDFSSDFTRFLQPKVKESMKRAALKKLFHSGQFHAMDGLDVYIDDYSKPDPIPEEMLRRMEQARSLLFPSNEEGQPAMESPDNLAHGPATDDVQGESNPPTGPPEVATG